MIHEIKDGDKLQFDNRISTHTMTIADLRETLDENILIKDAVLMVINPDYCKDADLYFSNINDAKEYLKTVFLGFDKGFISNVFAC